jgi:hypothetical protein
VTSLTPQLLSSLSRHSALSLEDEEDERSRQLRRSADSHSTTKKSELKDVRLAPLLYLLSSDLISRPSRIDQS